MSLLDDFSAAIAAGSVEIIDLTAPLSSSTPVLQLPPPFANTIAATLEKVSDFDDAGPMLAAAPDRLGGAVRRCRCVRERRRLRPAHPRHLRRRRPMARREVGHHR